MDIAILLITVGAVGAAVVVVLIAHDAGYKAGWDDGYTTAVEWHVHRRIKPQ